MSYASIILAEPSIVSYWQFNESGNIHSGTPLVLDSADSNPGANGNGGISIQQTGNGVIGPCFTFSGGTAFITVSDNANLGFTNKFSLEAWIKTSSSAAQDFIAKEKSGAPFNGYTFRILSTSGFLAVYVGDASTNVSSSTNVADGNWHHVVATVTTGGLVTLYVDGASVFSATRTPSPSCTTTMVLGSNAAGSGSSFIGSMMNLAIYNDTLSAARVLAHYQAGTTLGSLILVPMDSLNYTADMTGGFRG